MPKQTRQIDIIRFLRTGRELLGIPIGMTRENLISKLGPPIDEVGEGNFSFIYYKGGVRFFQENNVIVELGLDFNVGGRVVSFPIKIEDMENVKYFNYNTKLNVAIKMLKYLRIKWSSWDENNPGNIVLKTASDVFLLFDIDDGKIGRIIYRGPLTKAAS